MAYLAQSIGAFMGDLWNHDPKVDDRGITFFHELDWTVSPSVLIATGVSYIALVAALVSIMKGKKKMELKLIMQVYNVVQIVLCGYMTLGIGTVWLKNLGTGATTGEVFGSLYMVNMKMNLHLEYFLLIHYASKFLDLLDTVFIILRRKNDQLNFLHVYHHATIGPVWGFVLLMGYGGGTAAFGAMLNSFVHVVMYSHYLWCSTGRVNPFKSLITTTQIGQFYLCVSHAMFISFTTLEVETGRWIAIIQFFYHLTMISLFSAFYKKKFGKKVDGKKKN